MMILTTLQTAMVMMKVQQVQYMHSRQWRGNCMYMDLCAYACTVYLAVHLHLVGQ